MRKALHLLCATCILVLASITAYGQRSGGLLAASELIDLRADPEDSYNTLYKGPTIKSLHPGLGWGFSVGGWLSTNTSGSIGFRSGLALNLMGASYRTSSAKAVYQRLIRVDLDGHALCGSLQLPLLFEAHPHPRISVLSGITWKQELFRRGRSMLTIMDSSYSAPVATIWTPDTVNGVPDRVRYQQDFTVGLEYRTPKGLRIGVFAEHGLRHWMRASRSYDPQQERIDITRTVYKVQLAWQLFDAPAASRARRLLRRAGWDGTDATSLDTVPEWGPYFQNGRFWVEGGVAYTSGAYFRRAHDPASIDRLINEPAPGYGMQFAFFFHPDRPHALRFRSGARASMRRYMQRRRSLVREWDQASGMYAYRNYDGTVTVDDYSLALPLLFDVRIGAHLTAFFGMELKLSESGLEREQGQLTTTFDPNGAAIVEVKPYTLHLGDRPKPLLKVGFNTGCRYRLNDRFLVSAEYSAVQAPWMSWKDGGPVNELMLSGGWILRAGGSEPPKR